jgi:hypothetical protein
VPDGTTPFIEFTGVEVNTDPLQTSLVIEVIVATGFTVTINVNVEEHVLGAVPDVAVIVYIAVCAVFVGFVNVPKIFVSLTPKEPPVIPPVTVGDGQL